MQYLYTIWKLTVFKLFKFKETRMGHSFETFTENNKWFKVLIGELTENQR
jgi:hypothetical protein